MTKDEFKLWLTYHADTFAGLREWFGKATDQQATQDAWFRVIGEAELDHAKQATDKLFADPGRKVFGFNDHPAAIAQLAREIRWEGMLRSQDEYHSTDRYACHRCRDAGIRTVWHPKTMRDVYQGKPAKRYVTAVACNCRAGEKRKESNDAVPSRKPLVMLDETVMVITGGPSDRKSFEYLTRNIDALQKNTVKNSPNYETAFDDF